MKGARDLRDEDAMVVGLSRGRKLMEDWWRRLKIVERKQGETWWSPRSLKTLAAWGIATLFGKMLVPTHVGLMCSLFVVLVAGRAARSHEREKSTTKVVFIPASNWYLCELLRR